jgi:hypothetical protein
LIFCFGEEEIEGSNDFKISLLQNSVPQYYLYALITGSSTYPHARGAHSKALELLLSDFAPQEASRR